MLPQHFFYYKSLSFKFCLLISHNFFHHFFFVGHTFLSFSGFVVISITTVRSDTSLTTVTTVTNVTTVTTVKYVDHDSFNTV